MRESGVRPRDLAMRMRGSGFPRGEMDFTTSKHARAARALWPRKTAEHWAAAAGVSGRMAKFWLAGTHDVSPSGKLAIIRELD